VIYLDDIIIFSKTFEEHLQHIGNILDILQDENLKLNGKWAQTKIKVLGHIISHDTVEMDMDKIETIKAMQAPKTIKQVQQFLGLCNYYRLFIQSFSELAAPLHALLKKKRDGNGKTLHRKPFRP